MLYFTGSISKSMQNIMVLSKYGFLKRFEYMYFICEVIQEIPVGGYGTKIEKGRNFIVLSSRSILWTNLLNSAGEFW